MLRVCNHCHKEFEVYPSQIKKGEGLYCSVECYHLRNGEVSLLKCVACGKEFKLTPHDIKRGRGKYCSRVCWRKDKEGKPAHNFNSVEQTCPVCNKKYFVIPAKLKEGKGKFCSLECYRKDHSKNTWTVGICKNCGKEFKYIAHRKQTCCSLNCNSLYRWRDNTERWNKWGKDHKLGSSWGKEFTLFLRKLRRLSAYKKWREQILYRDNFKCVLCGSKENLEVDHLKSLISILWENNLTTIPNAIDYKPLWDISNGQVLCHKCHLLTETYGYKSAR